MAVAVEDLELSLQQSDTPYEVQTDKEVGKIVPCLGADGCETQLIVNTFYAPAKARCSEHGHAPRGDSADTPEGASRSEWPVGPREPAEKLEELFAQMQGDARFNADITPEAQTDKSIVKLVPCAECKAPLIVNQFYAPARARCKEHGGGGGRLNRAPSAARVGSLGVVQAGRTDPSKARNLEDALINKQFAQHDCILCGPDHPMELKHVTHNQNYGPSKLVGYDGDEPLYKTLPGETVMLQCNWCKLVLGISTSHVMVYRRQNEIKTSDRQTTHWETELGSREEDDDAE